MRHPLVRTDSIPWFLKCFLCTHHPVPFRLHKNAVRKRLNGFSKMEKRLRYRECGDYIYIHTHQTRIRNGNPNPLPPMFTDLVKIVLGFWSHLPRRGTIPPPPLPHLWKSTHLPLYRECLCLLTCRLESASLSPDLTP